MNLYIYIYILLDLSKFTLKCIIHCIIIVGKKTFFLAQGFLVFS